MILISAGDSLWTDDDLLRRIEDQNILGLEVLVHKTGDFALVDPGEPVVRLDNSKSPVLLVGVVVGHVVQVQLVLEQLSYHLGTFLHAGHPLVHGDGRPVEIPLDVQLVLLLVQVGEVAVQHQLGARLDHLRSIETQYLDSVAAAEDAEDAEGRSEHCEDDVEVD